LHITGDKLRILREKTGLTQEELSQKIGIKRATYAKYETGENPVPGVLLIKFADFFGCTTDYLLGRSPYKQKVVSHSENEALYMTESESSYSPTGNPTPPQQKQDKPNYEEDVLSSKNLDDAQNPTQLPHDIWHLVIDKNNYGLLKQIQAMKNKGYSNEVIIEWLTSLGNTLENIKTSGVFWGGEDLEESKKYTKKEKQEIVEGLKNKLSDPNFKPPWNENNVE